MSKAVEVLEAERIAFEPFRPIRASGGLIDRVLVGVGSAVAAWEALEGAVSQTGCWPLITGDAGDRDFQQEMQDLDPDAKVETVIRRAGTIDLAAWMKKTQVEVSGQFDDDPEARAYFDGVVNKRLDWPERPAKQPVWHASLSSFGRGRCDKAAISLVPTVVPWETPAWMRFGGFNACPDPEVHVAIMRHWHERYGASPVCMTFDTLEFRIAGPPQTQEAARALALEQYVYCNDIVDQGMGSVDALAMSLWQAPSWFFWWD